MKNRVIEVYAAVDRDKAQATEVLNLLMWRLNREAQRVSDELTAEHALPGRVSIKMLAEVTPGEGNSYVVRVRGEIPDLSGELEGDVEEEHRGYKLTVIRSLSVG